MKDGLKPNSPLSFFRVGFKYYFSQETIMPKPTKPAKKVAPAKEEEEGLFADYEETDEETPEDEEPEEEEPEEETPEAEAGTEE
jgi:hypothetical protein